MNAISRIAPRRGVSRIENAVELGPRAKFVVFFSVAIGTPNYAATADVLRLFDRTTNLGPRYSLRYDELGTGKIIRK
jgi:hypothetical protein